MSLALADKVAIITGAGRGLGRAFALRFAKEGAKLLLPDISLERAEDTVKEIHANGGYAVAMETDISSEKDTQEMAAKVITLYGKVDILLNNAAKVEGTDVRPWDGWTVEEWDRMFAVNVKGTWLCCRAIAPLMIKQAEGKIINIVSDLVKLPQAYTFLAYSCSKAAVYTLTHSLARALGPSGVNVNAIAPGLTITEASSSIPGIEQALVDTLSTSCLKRHQKPVDLVGAAVFLASEDSDFITGQTIVVNGGAVTI
jgi:NAD(P)-dependent dehydrogenase (short-subunit alcohol dehydrogenase family)